MNTCLLLGVVVFVACCGIVWFMYAEMMQEDEASRTDLARDASRCGLHSRY